MKTQAIFIILPVRYSSKLQRLPEGTLQLSLLAAPRDATFAILDVYNSDEGAWWRYEFEREYFDILAVFWTL